MKKVAIVSCYFKKNYGSMLQAYATQKVLDELKIENETINIEENVDFKKGKNRFYKCQIFNFSFIKSKLGMIKLKIDKKINKKLNRNINMRNNKFERFKHNFKLTKPFYTYQELTDACKNYSSVIVGSDQLWLPVNVVADYYTLNWVPENVNKISYATSFGISDIPNKYKNMYKKFLNRLNFISVREENACQLVRELSNKEAKLVCDPTILLEKNSWKEIEPKKRIIEGDYIFCYFLGKNIEHRKFAERLKRNTGYKIVSLNHCDEYVKYSDKFADITPYNIGPGEFINLIKHAKIVCTDSFHGTVFSLINNVNFFTFERFKSKNSKISTNSRIYSLLKIVNLEHRILKGNEKIEDVLHDIDFKKTNEKLQKYRESSIEFLKESLQVSIEEQKKNQDKFIEYNYKEECCGCTACKSICPQNAISMEEDEEGFKYPKIDKTKCINCGLCTKVCPIKNPTKEEKFEQSAYIVNNKNNNIREESTSGGAFTEIAGYVIDHGGVAFGATFDESYRVYHTFVETKEKLNQFRGSKYVQSDLNDSFKKVKEFLDNNRLVCFSGTPCQIEGLKRFLNKEYENLITVDIVCHAVPSPLFWRKYLQFQKQTLGTENIKKVYFRDKRKFGYKYSTMTIETDKKDYSEGVETDPYLRAFFNNLSDRPSCYNSKFKKQYRKSDFTIWDCFETEKFCIELDDDKGTTRILVHSEKGKKILNEILPNFNYKKVDTKDLVTGVKEMYYSVSVNRKRKEFFYDINNMKEKNFFNKYFPNNLKTKTEKIVRVNLAKTNVYKDVKKIVKKMIRK